MPNGRSGGFILEAAELTRLLETFGPHTRVGQLVTEGAPFNEVAVEKLKTLLTSSPATRFAVEEQDHCQYIIHFSNAPILWLAVDKGTTLYELLANADAQFQAEHPEWTGWIGF